MPSGLELSAQSAVCGAAKKGCSRRKYREFVPIWPSADRARVALEDDHHLRPLLARTTMTRYQVEHNLTDGRRHSIAGRAVTALAPRLSSFRLRSNPVFRQGVRVVRSLRPWR